MIGYCGRNCVVSCAAYTTEENPPTDVVHPHIWCRGCKADDDKVWEWVLDCKVRQCGRKRQVETCAHCPEYSCATLEHLHRTSDSHTRQQLEEIRQSLSDEESDTRQD